MNIGRNIFYTFILLTLIIIDQLVKYEIRTRGGFYICNRNFAFSLSFRSILLIFTILLFLVLVLGNFGNSKSEALNPKQYQNPNFKNPKQWFGFLDLKNSDLFQISSLGFRILPWTLIAAGAISNILDRLHYGCVTDFIDLHFWPVFNLADVYITIGVIALIIKITRPTDYHVKKNDFTEGK